MVEDEPGRAECEYIAEGLRFDLERDGESR